MVHTCIHWFRKGLRLHDNPALIAALRDCKELYPVFILDPYLHSNTHVGINRWRFLIGALKDLDCSLRKLNSRLFVVRGKPEDVFPKLFNKWKVTKLTYEYDTEPYSLSRDKKVMELAKEHEVEVIYKISHTLYDIDRIIEENNGKAPLTYNRMQAIVKTLGPPKKPIPAPTMEDIKDVKTPCSENHEKKYGIPALEELSQDTEALAEEPFPGGEQEALRRLDEHMKRTGWVCNFEKPQTSPNSLSPSTTVLSPYVTFGCLSARTFWWKLTEVYQGKKHSDPPVSLHGQLLWREFFYTASVGIPNFNKMEGNPVCTQVDWDANTEYLAAWREARTGFPFIDAIMTQLRQEGWIHHLARHAVACFLTRGDLWISWESGMKVFEELLLDADWSVNAGSWMWLSCSAFFQQFFLCYCPVGFGRRTDPSGDYIRRYIPILKDYPNRYIYEPWNAPELVQKAANCVVGVDYPKPMINHAEGSRLNIERMKQVYQQLSHYRGLSLLASVPTIQEEAEPPMTDESQTSSGPDSPPRDPVDNEAAGCSTAPDSSTVCASSTFALHPDLEDTLNCRPFQTPCTYSHTQASAAVTSTSANHPLSLAASPSLASTPIQGTLSRSKPSSPSSSCPTLSSSSSPAMTLVQTFPKRKSLARKVRRSQRQRGRQICTPSGREGERRAEEEEREDTGGDKRMEEDVEQDEERMEEETSEKLAGLQQ